MYEEYKVDVPEGSKGPWKIEKFVVPEKSIEGMREAWIGRSIDPGTYTRLTRNNYLVMSDTPAEVQDFIEAVYKAKGKVFINGLGLGVALKAILKKEEVIHVDVIEINQDLIDLVGPYYNDPRVVIHCADAYEFKPAKDERWNFAWHDIWDDICSDNLEGMKKLHRKYGKRCDKQASWCRYQCGHGRW